MRAAATDANPAGRPAAQLHLGARTLTEVPRQTIRTPVRFARAMLLARQGAFR
jgi:hypothetical protein